MTSSSVLLYWLVVIVASALAIAGIVITFRALFADRSRGRRRCPKCWYDMTGVAGRTCPECGREPRDERRLTRTRRHYRRAFAGVVAILLGASLFVGHEVIRKGWAKATPSAAYIVALPWLDPAGAGFKELAARHERGTLRMWELRLLVFRCIEVLETSQDPELIKSACRMLHATEKAGKELPYVDPLRASIRVSDVDRERALDALIRLIEHNDQDVRFFAVHTIGAFEERASDRILALLSCLDTPDQDIATAISAALFAIDSDNTLEWTTRDLPISITCLLPHDSNKVALPTAEFRECLENPARKREILLSLLAHDEPAARAAAIWMLKLHHADDGGVAERVCALAENPHHNMESFKVQIAIVHFAGAVPLTDVNARTLVAALADQGLANAGGLTAVSRFPNTINVFGPAIRPHLESDHPPLCLKAIAAWVIVGGDRREASAAAMRLIEQYRAVGFGQEAFAPFQALAWIDDRSPELLQKLAPLMNDASRDVRAGAAFAFASLGGDKEAATKLLGSMHNAEFENGLGILSARPGLSRLAAAGDIHLPTVLEWLESDTVWQRKLAIETLHWCGPIAAPALAKLRELRNDPDTGVAIGAKAAVNHLEWELANSEEAARRRKEHLSQLR